VIVEGDAAYGSQDHMKMVLKRDADDPERTWGFIFAIARTWKTVEGKAIKDWVTHLPRKYYRRTWVPRIPATNGRRSFWVYRTRLCLRHVGDVTVVLSKTGRNVGPSQTKILVTNLTELTSRYIVFAYQKRWAVGVSREGHINPVGESPTEVRSSSLVAWEAPWREIKTVEPSDTMLSWSMRKTPGCNVQ
jgi:hypothetical protein